MFASLDFVKANFTRFNELIFQNSLPEPKFRIGSSRRSLGSLRYIRRTVFGLIRYSDFTLTISNRLDLPKNVIEDTIIHEMIHLHILHKRIKDSSAHGKEFRKLMKSINVEFSRNISVSHSSTSQESASDRLKRDYYLVISRFNTGETYITSCARTRIFEFQNHLSLIPEIESWQWYHTQNPYFNKFPRSTSLKFYKISSLTLSELANARPCICDSKTFRWK